MTVSNEAEQKFDEEYEVDMTQMGIRLHIDEGDSFTAIDGFSSLGPFGYEVLL